MYGMLAKVPHNGGRVPTIELPNRTLHKQQGMGVGIARADRSSTVCCHHARCRWDATCVFVSQKQVLEKHGGPQESCQLSGPAAKSHMLRHIITVYNHTSHCRSCRHKHSPTLYYWTTATNQQRHHAAGGAHKCWMVDRALHDAGRVPLIELKARSLHEQQGMDFGIVRAGTSNGAS
jgi:hypothetical protein